MLSLLLIYFNKQNLRTRLLAGILVLAFIFVTVAAVGFRLFLYDPLAGYANSNTVFYLHLNLSAKGNYYETKILDTLLADFQLADFDRHQLKDELAVSCDQAPTAHCALIFFAKNKKQTETYFKNKHLAYQTSGFNTFFVTNNSTTSQTHLKKAWSPWIYWQFHSGLLKDDLTLVLKQISRPRTFSQRLLTYFQPGIRLSGNINNQGIVLKPLSFTAVKADWQSDYTNINQPQFDLLLNLPDTTKLNPLLLSYLNNVNTSQAGAALDILAQQPLTVAFNKIAATGNILNDYQIYLASTATLSSEQNSKITVVLQTIGAILQPLEKSLYLNDGSKITILSPNVALTGQTDGQSYKLPLNDRQTLFLESSSSGFSMGNDTTFKPQLATSSGNFGLIKISGLPEHNSLRNYLKEFSYLYFDNKKVIIK